MANYTPLSNSETAAFCSQMGMILKSGISPYEGLVVMLEDAKADDEKSLISCMLDTFNATGSMHEAVKESGAFPAYMASMVQIGEQTGKLDDVMESLGQYYTNEANLAATIRSTVTYPFVMALMMVAVILILITKVMPIFAQVFKQLGMELPAFSRGILAVGNFMNSNILVLAVLLAAILALGIYLAKSKSGQSKISGLSAKLSSTASIADSIAKYRFANGMALTLSSGLSPAECIKLTAELIPDGSLTEKISKCSEAVSNGADAGEAIREAGIFTGLQSRMMGIAAKSGTLDEAMKNIADQYDEEINLKITKLLSSIEPTLVIVLSVVVGIILLSVMLPLISIMSSI